MPHEPFDELDELDEEWADDVERTPGTSNAVSMFELATIRMQLTLATVGTSVPVDEQRILADWFGVLADTTHGDVDRFDVGVTATTDLSEIAWRVSGPTERFLPAVIDACDFVGASQTGRIQLEQVGLALAPARIGLALQVGRSGIDAEWFIPERIEVDELTGLTLPSDVADLVARDRRPLLAVNGGLGASAHLGVVRSIELSGGSLARQLAAQFEDAGVECPDPALLVAISELHAGDFLRTDWFDGSGRVKLSVVAAEPSVSTVLAAMSASGGVVDEVLADFVATLGVAGPRGVEVEQWADGTRTRLLVDVRPPA